MADFTISILPDELVAQVFEGFSYKHRYEAVKQEGETQQQFTRRRMLEILKRDAIEGLSMKAADEAAQAAANDQSLNGLTIE